MKALRTLAEGLVNVAIIVVTSGILLGIAVYLSHHVTCVNIFDKVCFVY